MNDTVPESAREEAVRWFALLHGPSRTAEADILFRKWCGASEINEAAYDLVTQTWERTSQLRKDPVPLSQKWQRAGFEAGLRRAMVAVVAMIMVAAAAGLIYLHNAGIHTDIGEQRTVTLPDSTRISLNTNTRLVVDYSDRRRLVRLKEGEALFEVARNAARPFVVQAADREIRALGTVFVVRAAGNLLAVTLVEGKVAVSAEGSAQTLQPGERLTFAGAAAPRRDRPEVQNVTAWRQGRIEMNRMPLYVAAAEMNRYSTVRLVVEQPEAQVIPITGSFRTGDIASLAETLIRTCHLNLVHEEDRIVLSGRPSENCR